jgi:hypothetical protein
MIFESQLFHLFRGFQPCPFSFASGAVRERVLQSAYINLRGPQGYKRKKNEVEFAARKKRTGW